MDAPTTIYCIGLSGNGGIDTQALIDWASNPASAYVVITPSDEELETIFSDLAQNISKPGAKNIIIRDVVSSFFKIISFDSPTKGSASLLNVSYEDKDLNIASFPSPEIEINCGDAVFPERCIKFVLPEDLDVSGSSNMICDTRNFKARFIAHYIDNDFECCNNVY